MLSLPDPIDVDVGARMRVRRKLLKMSQAALAESVGITFQQIQKYERGTNRVSASMLVRIAQRLDTTVAALVGEDRDEAQLPEPGLYPLLAVTGGIELLKAYAQVEDPKSRLAVVELVRAMGREAPP